MTPDSLALLQHALGLDAYGRRHTHRNCYCACPGDVELCRALVAQGLMTEHRARPRRGGTVFHVTPAGTEAVALNSPQPPKAPRGRPRRLAVVTHVTALEHTA